MPKQNRKPGIHLHKTEVRTGPIKSSKVHKDLYETEYYWTLIAKNGKTIARSSETYKRKRDAVRSMRLTAAHFNTNQDYFDHTKKEVEQVVY